MTNAKLIAWQKREQSPIEKALRRAYSLGQTYWQQGDSASYSQNRKSDETAAKFEALVAENIAPIGELVALRRNAARYKVLRDARHGFNAYRLQPKQGKRWRGWGDEGDILRGNALDAAIDAALSTPETTPPTPEAA